MRWTRIPHLAFALFQALILASALVATARADTMVIPPYADVLIFEGDQAAIIAWNGTHEYLLLSVSLWASWSGSGERNESSVVAVQVMPLPSIPDVSKGDRGVFDRLREVLLDHLSRKYGGWPYTRGSYMSTGIGGQAEAVNITLVFFKEIGVHHLAVLEIHDVRQLVDWVRRFYANKGIDLTGQEALLERVEAIAGDYVRRGYRYFTVDVIELGPEARTVEPLTYVFECDHVYYPLYISSAAEGETHVKLFVLASAWISDERASAAGLKVVLRDELSDTELLAISPDIYEFMNEEPVKLTELVYHGPASELKTDLEVRPDQEVSELQVMGWASLGLGISSSAVLMAIPVIRWARRADKRSSKLPQIVYPASALALILAFAYVPMAMTIVGPPHTAVDARLAPAPVLTCTLMISASACLTGATSTANRWARPSVLISLLVVLASVVGLLSLTPSPAMPITALLSSVVVVLLAWIAIIEVINT